MLLKIKLLDYSGVPVGGFGGSGKVVELMSLFSLSDLLLTTKYTTIAMAISEPIINSVIYAFSNLSA